MPAQSTERRKREPETLKRHREMYEERLKLLRLTQGQTEKEVTEKANNPNLSQNDNEVDAPESKNAHLSA